MMNPRSLILAASLCISFAMAADNTIDFSPKPPVQPLSPAEEAKTFQLPLGYRLELVLSEPDIMEPVCMAFDGNGRLYVAEMRSYMRDLEATDELTPTSRVSVHWSSKNDGVYDQHRVYADKLVLPRLLLPLADGVLIGETNTNDINLYRDTNGDGVSDEKKLVYQGGARGENMEHQPSGLTWANDNWLYTAMNNYRLRWKDGMLMKQEIPGNGGQWGGSQDDDGKYWVVNAGGERGPVSFQQHVLYGRFTLRQEFEPGFEVVWPAMGLRDFQGGPDKARDDNTLNHFTATCGGEIYRGDQLPAELKGNLFFGEPVGRLVRRATIEVNDGITILHNPHPQNEFLRSTDACFRPIDMKTAPDGTLFICDMYRGVIQEGTWVTKGGYLRKTIQQHGMENIMNRGRIWRLVHESTKPVPAPKLLEATPTDLVTTLTHPNGWYRDTAQKLLVLKQDQSVAPALIGMLQKHDAPLARIHALWTLEGLGALTPDLVRGALKDKSVQVRHAAIRASESVMDAALQQDVLKLATDPDPTVVIQTLLTAKLLKWKELPKLANATAMTTPSKGVRAMVAEVMSNSSNFPQEFSETQKASLHRGNEIYQQLCYTCHGIDGGGTPIDGQPGGATTLAPPLSRAKAVIGHRDGLILALLHGVTGPVNGKTYQAQMIPMAGSDNVWIADVLSYVRNRFGNTATMIEPEDVERVRKSYKDRTMPWTEEELHALAPPVLTNRSDWKFTSSENVAGIEKCVDGDMKTRWSSEKPLKKDMWITIELPAEASINGLRFAFWEGANILARGLRIETSKNGKQWDKPVYDDGAITAITEISFAPVTAKFIKIKQTGKGNNNTPWHIHELDINVSTPATH